MEHWSNRPRGSAVVGTVSLLVLAALAPLANLPTVATATPTAVAALDHFTCYKAGATSGSVKFPGIPNPPGVTLVDQFGPSTVEVKKAKFLCAPTDKLDEDPTAPDHPEHLEGYQIKNADKPALPTNLTLVDQFNPTGLLIDAKKPSHLLVPTVKDRLTPPPLPGAFSVDHFQCYKAATSKGAPKFVPVPNVEIEDQFGVMRVDVKKPKYLCLPVDKNGEDPTAPTHPDHLLCYQVKQVDAVKFPKVTGVFVNNQFGPEQLDVKKPSELCVPALKNPPPTPTPITTPSPTPTVVCATDQWAGNYSGTYTGDENGTWTGTTDTAGTMMVQVNSPGCGVFTGTGSISACGGFEATTGGSAFCGPTTITWTGTYTLSGGVVFGSGTWNASSGFSGTWTGMRN